MLFSAANPLTPSDCQPERRGEQSDPIPIVTFLPFLPFGESVRPQRVATEHFTRSSAAIVPEASGSRRTSCSDHAAFIFHCFPAPLRMSPVSRMSRQSDPSGGGVYILQSLVKSAEAKLPFLGHWF